LNFSRCVTSRTSRAICVIADDTVAVELESINRAGQSWLAPSGHRKFGGVDLERHRDIQSQVS